MLNICSNKNSSNKIKNEFNIPHGELGTNLNFSSL